MVFKNYDILKWYEQYEEIFGNTYTVKSQLL